MILPSAVVAYLALGWAFLTLSMLSIATISTLVIFALVATYIRMASSFFLISLRDTRAVIPNFVYGLAG